MQIELPFISQSGGQLPDVFTLFLTGEINTQNATELCEKLKYIETLNRLNQNNHVIPVELVINSPGGDLFSSWMICDVMNSMNTPVQTVAMGQVASGGLLIFMNGLKGWRLSTPNTQFMSHRFITSLQASHHELKNQQLEWDRIHRRIIDHYKRCTGLTEKAILKELLPEHDVWLTAEECHKLGICDIIDTSRHQPDDKIKRQSKKNKKQE